MHIACETHSFAPFICFEKRHETIRFEKRHGTIIRALILYFYEEGKQKLDMIKLINLNKT